MTSPTILIADDHAIIRRGIQVLLDMHYPKCVIKECSSVRQIMPALQAYSFTHLILDMQLQDGNVIDLMPELVKMYPGVPVMIYSMSSEEIFGARMLQLGASCFLSKQSSEQEVVKALGFFLSGRPYVSAELQDIIRETKTGRAAKSNPIATLSDRELSVLNSLLRGESVKEISVKLDLKPTTVATYKARIFDKLNATNIIELRNICDLYQYKKS